METLKTIFGILVLELIALGFLGLMFKPFISSKRDNNIRKQRAKKKDKLTYQPDPDKTDSTIL